MRHAVRLVAKAVVGTRAGRRALIASIPLGIACYGLTVTPFTLANNEVRLVGLYGKNSEMLTTMAFQTEGTINNPQNEDEKLFGVAARGMKFQEGDWNAEGVQVGINTSTQTQFGKVDVEMNVVNLSNKTFGTGKVNNRVFINSTTAVDIMVEKSFVPTMEAIKENVTSTLGGAAITTLVADKTLASAYVAGQRYSDGNIRGLWSASVAKKFEAFDVCLKYQGFTNSQADSPFYFDPKNNNQITAGISTAQYVKGWKVAASANAGMQKADAGAKPIYGAEARIVSPSYNGAKIALSLSTTYEGATTYQKYGTGPTLTGWRNNVAAVQVSIPF